LDAGLTSIADICRVSIQESCKYLGMSKDWIQSSSQFQNQDLSGVERVLDICNKTKATHYVNAPGGKSLYDKQVFQDAQLELSFIRSSLPAYTHNSKPALMGLSILDVIAWNEPEVIRSMMLQYTLE